MSICTVSRLLALCLVPLASLASLYLYLYPLFNGCAFPLPGSSPSPVISWATTLTSHNPHALWPASSHELAPFRLLVLADPQLEGDSSLPRPEDSLWAKLVQHRKEIFHPHQTRARRKAKIYKAIRGLLRDDIPDALRALQKRLDLFGNDYYLAHIYRTLHWWTRPSHATVLGDLIGSQWVTDEEFDYRAWRFWRRVFAGSEPVEFGEQLFSDEKLLHPRNPWANRLINIAGNHDIGYAGDISEPRLSRFEKNFGRANWDIRFRLPQSNTSTSPSLHLIILNDLLLDTPALSRSLQGDLYDYLNQVITERSRSVDDKTSFTLLLTHVPLRKPAGVCVDAPHFGFHDADDAEHGFEAGGLKEQNHLSEHASRAGILEGVFGMSKNREAAGGGKGRKGLILTGHDHEGCDVWHYLPESSDFDRARDSAYNADDTDDVDGWRSTAFKGANISDAHTGIREITLRSMMGYFGGNAGLLSLWFDTEQAEWRFEMQMCPLGVQHIWWGVHVLDLVAILVLMVWGLASWFERAKSAISSGLTPVQKDKHLKSEKGGSKKDEEHKKTKKDGTHRQKRR